MAAATIKRNGQIAERIGVETLSPGQKSQQSHAEQTPYKQKQPYAEEWIAADRRRDVKQCLDHIVSRPKCRVWEERSRNTPGFSRQLSIRRVFSTVTARAASVGPRISSTASNVFRIGQGDIFDLSLIGRRDQLAHLRDDLDCPVLAALRPNSSASRRLFDRTTAWALAAGPRYALRELMAKPSHSRTIGANVNLGRHVQVSGHAADHQRLLIVFFVPKKAASAPTMLNNFITTVVTPRK